LQIGKNAIIGIQNYLKTYFESGEFDFRDKTGKFNFDTFNLKDVRTYKKKEVLTENGEKKEISPEKGVWKFENYKNHHNIGTPFINDTKSDYKICDIAILKSWLKEKYDI